MLHLLYLYCLYVCLGWTPVSTAFWIMYRRSVNLIGVPGFYIISTKAIDCFLAPQPEVVPNDLQKQCPRSNSHGEILPAPVNTGLTARCSVNRVSQASFLNYFLFVNFLYCSCYMYLWPLVVIRIPFCTYLLLFMIS